MGTGTWVLISETEPSLLDDKKKEENEIDKEYETKIIIYIGNSVCNDAGICPGNGEVRVRREQPSDSGEVQQRGDRDLYLRQSGQPLVEEGRWRCEDSGGDFH